MKYAFLGCFILACVIVILLILRRKKGREQEKDLPLADDPKAIAAARDEMKTVAIAVDSLPVADIDETKLQKISDPAILERVSAAVPGLLTASVAAGTAISTHGQTLYRAILPAGATLAQSKEIEGAFRGIYHGKKGIEGAANFIKVESKGITLANTVSSVMSLASVIIGQYYMSRINKQITKLQEGIAAIGDFQDTEYKGKVEALISQVSTAAAYRIEVMENAEVRQATYIKCEQAEKTCIELLGQANAMLERQIQKSPDEFEEYEKSVSDGQKWYSYQQILLVILKQLADLKFAIYEGTLPREHCDEQYRQYAEKAKAVIDQLGRWHAAQMEKFEINLDTAQRKRTGVARIVLSIPALFDETLKFQTVSASTVAQIEMQTHFQEVSLLRDNLFREKVCLIARGEELYYYPEEEPSEMTDEGEETE